MLRSFINQTLLPPILPPKHLTLILLRIPWGWGHGVVGYCVESPVGAWQYGEKKERWSEDISG